MSRIIGSAVSLGVIAGFFLAYPSNVWMVARGLKHGYAAGHDHGP
jgi:hypothetical protein